MSPRMMLPLLVALGAGLLGAIAAAILSARRGRVVERLQELKTGGSSAAPAESMKQLARAALPRLGTHLMPTDEKERTRLHARLVQAGLYGRQAMVLFLGVKMLLMAGPATVGLIAGLAGLGPMKPAFLYGACLGIVGMVGPSMWLDKKKAARQMIFRRGLPDALDVIVICVEGGLSLVGALKRVAADLRAVHPELALELEIVQR